MSEEAAEALPFDTVRVGEEEIRVQAFLALPLVKRLEVMLSGELVFLDNNEPIERSIALKALRARSVHRTDP